MKGLGRTQARSREEGAHTRRALLPRSQVVKLLALSLAGYWADSFNRFDGFIVLASSLEIVVEELDLPVNTQV